VFVSSVFAPVPSDAWSQDGGLAGTCSYPARSRQAPHRCTDARWRAGRVAFQAAWRGSAMTLTPTSSCQTRPTLGDAVQPAAGARLTHPANLASRSPPEPHPRCRPEPRVNASAGEPQRRGPAPGARQQAEGPGGNVFVSSTFAPAFRRRARSTPRLGGNAFASSTFAPAFRRRARSTPRPGGNTRTSSTFAPGPVPGTYTPTQARDAPGDRPLKPRDAGPPSQARPTPDRPPKPRTARPPYAAACSIQSR
jgi:hypothetical protein